MKKKKIVFKRKKKNRAVESVENSLNLHASYIHLNKSIEKTRESVEKLEEKIQDIEIHTNLLTRLLTTLCIEKFGMRVGVLKRLIKRIEKEAIRDSQILHLEALYKLSPETGKKGPSTPPSSKNDPWEDIS